MKRFIRVGQDLVEVSEKIYKEYHKMGRRERYMESDIKVGRIDVDADNEEVTFIPSKEDSIERLEENGMIFSDEQSIEDIVCDKATLLILQEALKELDSKEQRLIQDIYYKNKTTREIAKKENVSQPAIVKQHKKIIKKMKRLFL